MLWCCCSAFNGSLTDHRTPPAVGVTLNKSVFEKLSNNSDPEVVQEGYIDSYFKYCNNSGTQTTVKLGNHLLAQRSIYRAFFGFCGFVSIGWAWMVAYSGKETEINGAMLGWSRFPSKEFPSVVHQLLPTTPTHNVFFFLNLPLLSPIPPPLLLPAEGLSSALLFFLFFLCGSDSIKEARISLNSFSDDGIFKNWCG